MGLLKYNFYVGKRVKYATLTRNRSIDSAGNFIFQSGYWASNKLALGSGEHLVLDIACSTTRSRVYFYDGSGAFLKMTHLLNKRNSVIPSPSGAAYYAVTFVNGDISGVYSEGNEVDFIYLSRIVEPHYKELSKKYARENGQEFFRASLDGKITLFGSDYEHVYSADIEDQFIFLIEKYYPGSDDEQPGWLQYFRGEFSKTDCRFDYERKKCELSISPKDDYTTIMDKYENTYDLIKLAPALSKISLHKRSLMQIYVLGSNTISNFFGGTYWEDEVKEAVDSHDKLVNTHHFAYVMTANEFDVTISDDAEYSEYKIFEGKYTGSNGTWSNENGCTAKVVANRVRFYEGDSTELISTQPTQWSIGYDEFNQAFLITGLTCPLQEYSDGPRIGSIKNIIAYAVYRRLLADIDTMETTDGTKTLYDLPADDFVSDNRNYKKCIGLSGGQVYCTSATTTTPTRYGVNDDGNYFTNQFLPLSLGSIRPLPICRSAWINASLWFAYDSYYEVWEPQIRKRYTINDNYSIADVIKALLSQIDPTLKHEATTEYSQFLYGDTNPLAPERFYVYLTQKSNMLKGDYDQPAQKAEITLAQVMNMLRDCFRCYWYIEDGKLKIEHVWFFINGGSYSTTSKAVVDFVNRYDRFNKKPALYFQSEVEYDKSELAKRYEFSWMDDATEVFGGVVLDVQSNYVQQDKTENINPGQFSSDIDYMLFNPSAFSNDGFALLCPIKNNDGEYELPIVSAALLDDNRQQYTAVAQNWYASWAYLTQRFYTRDMPARLIRSNVSLDLLATPKMSMKRSIEFPWSGEINERWLIHTDLGDGKIDEYSVNMTNGQTKVKLAYSPK